jgi:hypothetical protein
LSKTNQEVIYKAGPTAKTGRTTSEPKCVEVSYPFDRFEAAYGSDNSKSLQIRLEAERIGNSDLYNYNGLVYVNHYDNYPAPEKSSYETATVSFETFVEFMREAIPELVKREEAKRTPYYREVALNELKTKWTVIDSCGFLGCREKSVWQMLIANKLYKSCNNHYAELTRLAQMCKGA